MNGLASFTSAGRAFWGVATNEGMIALSQEFPQWRTLRNVIENKALSIVLEAARNGDVTHPAGTFDWDIPVPDPEKIICVGVNYPDRNAEYKDGQEAPPNPSLFIRFARSFVGHGQPLIRPPESEKLDYEGEIAIVIGRPGRRIAEADAWRHVAAMTLANEGTIRDWVRHAKFNVTQGKNWDASGAIGPWLVPLEGPEQLADIRLTTRVNGKVRQDDRTGRMIFPVPYLIHYISTFTTLVPGDVILTGTPTGAGARFDPPVWLVPGDEIVVEADGIGRLVNGVTDE
ncbi:fumarylacetoacetate hydrolase family protein [Rhodobacteraceae bacterium ASV31]|nr:fumarylacetoacetate hydrolase family protein [Anianabacter salinae]